MRVLLGLLAFVAACRKESPLGKPSPQPQVLAAVGDAVITVEQFQAELAQRSRNSAGRYNDAAGREALLDEMIQFEVLFSRAQAAGYDQRPDIRERFRRLVVARYEQDQAPNLDAASAPSSSEIESYYEQHKAEWTEPAKVRPALLFWKVSAKATSEKRQEAIARAEKIRAAAVANPAPGSFGDLARQHSEDAATRYSGGDCGWIPTEEAHRAWPSKVVAAMLELPPGEISPVLSTAEGLYLVKVIDRSAATAKPLAAAREHIAWKLTSERQQQKQKQFAEQQRAGLRIVVNRAALDSISVPTTNLAQGEGSPPALPKR